MQLPEPYRNFLRKKGRSFTVKSNIKSAIKELDVLYVNRIQTERHKSTKDLTSLKSGLTLTPRLMQLAKDDMIILDCLPRVHEVTTAVDPDPRAAYFSQAENGLYVRMALLDSLLQP